MALQIAKDLLRCYHEDVEKNKQRENQIQPAKHVSFGSSMDHLFVLEFLFLVCLFFTPVIISFLLSKIGINIPDYIFYVAFIIGIIITMFVWQIKKMIEAKKDVEKNLFYYLKTPLNIQVEHRILESKTILKLYHGKKQIRKEYFNIEETYNIQETVIKWEKDIDTYNKNLQQASGS